MARARVYALTASDHTSSREADLSLNRGGALGSKLTGKGREPGGGAPEEVRGVGYRRGLGGPRRLDLRYRRGRRPGTRVVRAYRRTRLLNSASGLTMSLVNSTPNCSGVPTISLPCLYLAMLGQTRLVITASALARLEWYQTIGGGANDLPPLKSSGRGEARRGRLWCSRVGAGLAGGGGKNSLTTGRVAALSQYSADPGTSPSRGEGLDKR